MVNDNTHENGLTELTEAIDHAMIGENAFPITSLPSFFKDFVIDMKDALNFPVDYSDYNRPQYLLIVRCVIYASEKSCG